MSIKPEEVGCKLPYLGLEEVPDDSGSNKAFSSCRALMKSEIEKFESMKAESTIKEK